MRVGKFLGMVVVATTVALGATTLNATVALGQDEDDPGEAAPEFGIGDWLGSAWAGGTTTAEYQGIEMVGTGEFLGALEFGVTETFTFGSIDLEGSSVWNAEGLIEGFPTTFRLDQDSHSMRAEIDGDRQRLSFEGDVTTTGSINANVDGNSFSQAASSVDPIGPIELVVTDRFCNEASGEWILSWNTQLDEAGYTPTFGGEWVAVRQGAEFTENTEGELTELLEHLGELERRGTELVTAVLDAGPGNSVGAVADPADFFVDLYRLSTDLVEALNRLRNFTPCDREVFGPDQVEQWDLRFSQLLAGVVYTWIDEALEAGLIDALPGEALRYMAGIAEVAGAMGEHARPGVPDVSPAIDDAVSAVVEAHATVGADGSVEVENNTDTAQALAMAIQHGWQVEIDGTNYDPVELLVGSAPAAE